VGQVGYYQEFVTRCTVNKILKKIPSYIADTDLCYYPTSILSSRISLTEVDQIICRSVYWNWRTREDNYKMHRP